MRSSSSPTTSWWKSRRSRSASASATSPRTSASAPPAAQRPSAPEGSLMPQVSPIVRLLLIANVAGYALQWVTNQRITVLLALWPPGGDAESASLFHWWQLVTHAFQHDPSNI